MEPRQITVIQNLIQRELLELNVSIKTKKVNSLNT